MRRGFAALGYCGLLSLAACGPDAPSESDPSTAGPSTGGTTPTPPTWQAARKVDVASIDAADLVQAVLDECHKPVAQRMSRVMVSVTLPDATEAQPRRLLVQADLPHRARVREGLREHLWVKQQIHRLDAGAQEEPIETREARRAEVEPLVRIVDAVAFGPLYRAKGCQRLGDGFAITDAAGKMTTLRLHPGTLIPRSLTYTDGRTVHFDDYLRTASTWIVSRATLSPLGACQVVFEDGGMLFADEFFAPPGSSTTPKPTENVHMPAPGVVKESESTTPITVIGKAVRWVVLDAGDDWQQRHELYTPVHDELEEQNQRIFGFPMIWEQDGKTMLGAPFKQREGGKELQAPTGWRIESSPATAQLVVYPNTGTVAERIAAGTTLLRRTALNRKLKMIGPIVAQPFVHLHEGVPSTEKLADCKVRMSVRIESP